MAIITGTLNALAPARKGRVPAGQHPKGPIEPMVVDQAGGIGEGVAVLRSATNPERGVVSANATITGAATDVDLFGITVENPSASLRIENGVSVEYSNYNDGDAVAVLRRGRIWVEMEEAGTAGDQVYVRVVAAGAETLGAFRVSEDPGSAGDTVVATGWFVRRTSSGSNNITEIERR